MSRKILILTGDGGDSYEALYAYHRFLEARWEPVVAAPARRSLHMLIQDFDPEWDMPVHRPGHCLDPDVAITAVAAREFAALMLPGGRAPEHLRNNPGVLSLIREFDAQKKFIFAIGHGVQLLTAAGLTNGRKVTCHQNIEIEVEKDGGKYVDKPAVRDGSLVTAQTWQAHPEFYREIFACLGE